MISLVANEVATDEIKGGLREGNYRGHLLVEAVWNTFQGHDTFSENQAAGVETKDAVHVS